jgi:hypothetical protein
LPLESPVLDESTIINIFKFCNRTSQEKPFVPTLLGVTRIYMVLFTLTGTQIPLSQSPNHKIALVHNKTDTAAEPFQPTQSRDITFNSVHFEFDLSCRTLFPTSASISIAWMTVTSEGNFGRVLQNLDISCSNANTLSSDP